MMKKGKSRTHKAKGARVKEPKSIKGLKGGKV